MTRHASPAFLALALAACAAAAGAQTPGPAPQPPDANEIYDRARAAANAWTRPPFIAYSTLATFERKGRIKAERYRVVVRTSDGKSYVTPVADSPRDRIDTTPRVDEKPPYLSLFKTFGLADPPDAEKPASFEAPGTPAPAASAPPLIAGVKVTARAYDVTLLGTEALGGQPVYHLALRPAFDPKHHRLRELFVTTDSYRLERSVIEAYAAAGPFSPHPFVTIDYAPVGGAQAIVRISVDITLRAFFIAYGGHGEFHAENLAAPATEPDWMFDAALLAEHVRTAASAPRP